MTTLLNKVKDIDGVRVSTIDGRPLHRDLDFLSKLAESVEASDTVDKILSLGYINSGNLDIFLGNLHELRAAESALAEMLVASRLGQKGLDQEAIQSAMYALNETLQDLESLSSEREILERDVSKEL